MCAENPSYYEWENLKKACFSRERECVWGGGLNGDLWGMILFHS
jgi:hypothetical protein